MSALRAVFTMLQARSAPAVTLSSIGVWHDKQKNLLARPTDGR
jgi:hypothetical protein